MVGEHAGQDIKVAADGGKQLRRYRGECIVGGGEHGEIAGLAQRVCEASRNDQLHECAELGCRDGGLDNGTRKFNGFGLQALAVALQLSEAPGIVVTGLGGAKQGQGQ